MTEDTKIEMKDKIDWLGLFVNGLVYLIKGLIFLVSTPIFLGMWLLNFLRSLIGTAIAWVIGKFAIYLLTGLFLEIGFYFKVITQDKGDSIMSWLEYHLLGYSEWFNVNAPNGAINLLSYPTVEITLIIILAVVTATMMTIDPDRL